MTMVLRDGDSSSKPKKSLEDLMESGSGNLISKINKLKEKIEAERMVQIKEKMEKNKEKLQSHICGIQSVPLEVNTSLVDNTSDAPQLGLEKQGILLNGLDPGLGDKDLGSIQEVVFPKSTKLPKVQSIPRYTTWIFLDRNQRMAEDQSVVGRRRIYYDQTGNEALLCTDSEDDMAEIEEEKRDFSEGEDRILWMAFMEHGSDNNVAEVVSHIIGGNPSEIQERFNELKLKYEVSQEQGSSGKNLFLEKSLSTALDSFDNLFCRRCLVFDCRLHGCSQNLVYPSEKPLSLSEPEITKPCSDQCFLLVNKTTEGLAEGSQTSSPLKMNCDLRKRVTKGSKVLNIRDKVSSQDVDIGCNLDSFNGDGQPSNVVKRKITIGNDNSDISESSEDCVDKKMKKVRALEHLIDGNTTRNSNNNILSQISSGRQAIEIVEMEGNDSNERDELQEPTVSLVGQRDELFSNSEWRPLEKDLYLKGLEIFGSNSCLIARNLLSGLKTCSEVFNYMRNNMTHNMENARSSDNISRANSDNLDEETPMRSRTKLVRKRGRTRRLKYSSKSNGHPSSWKRIGGGEHSRKQYTPCSCKKTCGRDCSCLNNGSCCEKYCGCDKSCKNRFRGCHCGKGQCKSRQCPCFAANRECDPDVCRNCWVSCGGDSLGEPPKRGDGLCENMKLLLRQQQRILLGRSDVAGWGAFIKNSVNKNDYLGEYTGELISHREADKRGKIYDRANSSFLFDLNDEYVLDACRQGDKLKFANHSSKPNCYCKIMLVGGDHRVGIFAGERIEAGQELFYDYRYGPEQAPVWARRPESSKTDDLPPSQGRPRKHQSRGVQ